MWQIHYPLKRKICHEEIEFTEEQIAYTLKQAEKGGRNEDLFRKTGNSAAMFCHWKRNLQ